MSQARSPLQSDSPSVLTVDDEKNLVEIFSYWLEDHGCEVSTATNGPEALALLSDDIDVVILDRCMPGLSGDEVLQRIRERGYQCRVAVVSAVEPEIDIIEMGFDAYLTKPITREDLEKAVDCLINRSVRGVNQQEYFALSEKQALLHSRLSRKELEESEEYAALEQRLTELEAELGEQIDEFGRDDFMVAFRDLQFDGDRSARGPPDKSE